MQVVEIFQRAWWVRLRGMAHYVIRVTGLPEAVKGGSQVSLSVVSDDAAHRRVALVRVVGAEPATDVVWGAAVLYAVEQIEFGFKGQNWGVQVEDAAPLLVEVTGETADRLADDPSEGLLLKVGGIVGEFDV